MKRKLTSCLLVAGFMLATAPSAFAETYFIKADGDENGDGLSWETAISYDYFAENMEQGNFADGDVFCFAGGVYKLSSPDFDKYLLINRNVTFWEDSTQPVRVRIQILRILLLMKQSFQGPSRAM